MPPGNDWGRKAVGKFDKRLEDDELFKEIGGQLDASNFDYSQWQRTGKARSDLKINDVKQRKPIKEEGPGDVFTVSAGGVSFPVSLPKRTDPRCHHGQAKEKKQTISAVYEEAKAKKKAEQIKILQLRIHARRQTIAEYRKRQAELLIDNMQLRDSVVQEEKHAHDDVKKLLRKYEKFRGGISTLNCQFVEDLSDAKVSLDQAQVIVDHDVAELQKRVDEVDQKLKKHQEELHILVNYKDKEYPVKSLRISELQTELAELKLSQEEEQGELQHIVDTELDKFSKDESDLQRNITAKATEEVISKMHPSLKDMAMQNYVMVKELEFHKQEIEQLEDCNKGLDKEVKALLKDPKTSIRQQMFPEFFPIREKCTPDMDVVLDIPTQDWLPI